MKPSRWLARIGLAWAGGLGHAAGLGAQGSASDASLFLLLPVGARSTALGSAVAGQSGTSEALWWNPAGLAAITGSEIALNHSQSLVGVREAMALARRTRVGTFALGVHLLQRDGGDVVPGGGDTTSAGTILLRTIGLTSAYSATIGSRFRVGAAWKWVQVRFDCSGECPPSPPVLATTAAADLGAQMSLSLFGVPVDLGLALRNVGSSLGDDGDVDPAVLQGGISARYTIPASLAQESQVRGFLDMVVPRDGGRVTPRVGAEFGWADAVFVRGGSSTSAVGSLACPSTAASHRCSWRFASSGRQ